MVLDRKADDGGDQFVPSCMGDLREVRKLAAASRVEEKGIEDDAFDLMGAAFSNVDRVPVTHPPVRPT